MNVSSDETPAPSRRREWTTFLILTLVILPALAIAFVGTWGLVVWISHIINGPPTVKF
ncbi:nitrate reductase NapE [Shimia isoporae]|uniref:Nitrate reductase NapE n=1 Tax=Shimia isoporae TaxID=647720 RepID=A0A4V2Q3S7_9RHOB|nr:periplasmic nitrate reductase, NapE protein [Shimia isoporae]TCL08350.1 nitrate reductase NapE [Shimia isoporae]